MSRALQTADDLRRRATYLAEVIDQLYPRADGPAPRRAQVDGEARSYIVVPNRRKPRVLIPAVDRKVAAGALPATRARPPGARGPSATRPCGPCGSAWTACCCHTGSRSPPPRASTTTSRPSWATRST
ncbi:hypothetical protein GCM10029992_29820 [Glycomyces albus]